MIEFTKRVIKKVLGIRNGYRSSFSVANVSLDTVAIGVYFSGNKGHLYK